MALPPRERFARQQEANYLSAIFKYKKKKGIKGKNKFV
jgi:hypothetical protein